MAHNNSALFAFNTAPDRRKDTTGRNPPKVAIGVRRLGLIVIDECPFCGERHRYRDRKFGAVVMAHCGGDGGLRLVERED